MAKAKTEAPPAHFKVDGIRVVECERCPALCQSRKRIVNAKGPATASIMLVGEAPGNDEDVTGQPFMGHAGNVMGALLADAGVDPDDLHTVNATRCRPPGNRKPTIVEIRNCRPYLIEEIRQVQPKVIIAVGATALASLMGKAMSIGNVIGQVLTQPDTGVPIVPTYHPAYLMRGKWGLAGMVTAHLVKAKQVARGTLKAQTLEEAQGGAQCITTIEQLKALRDYLLSDAISIITLDTESYGVSDEWTGLDWLGAELLCASFSGLDAAGKPIGVGFAVPVLQKGGEDFWHGDDACEAWVILGEIMASDKPKCIQNAGHDIRLIERDPATDPLDDRLNTPMPWALKNLRYDTMIMQRLLDENLPAKESVMIALYTDLPYYEEDINAQTQNKLHMERAENETLWTYAALDADGLARVLAVLIKKMKKHPALEWIHENISIPMIYSCWNMTRRGVAIDIEYFIRLCERYEVLLAEAKKAVFDAYGHPEFNLNSTKQLQHALHTVLKLPKSGRKTKASKGCTRCEAENEGGEPCSIHDQTGKDAINDIIRVMNASGRDPHPILPALLTHATIKKQKGTYVNGATGEGGVLRFIREDACVHPEYGVNVADTGRLGAYRPPIQTIPKNVDDPELGHNTLRRPYVARPGYRLGEADWSQGELWVMGYRSGDETLLKLLRDGRDIHTYVAREMCKLGLGTTFPKSAVHPEMSEGEWKGLFDELRRKAKVFVFGINYEMTEMGISARTGADTEESATLRNAYTTTVFPGLDRHFAEVRESLMTTGMIEDEFGRQGHYPDYEFVKAHSFHDWEEVLRKAGNMPIQGGLNDLHQYMHPRLEVEFDGRIWIVTAVHDSLLFEYPEELTQEAEVALMWDIKRYAEDTAQNLVKWDGSPLGWEIPVELQWGGDWGNLKNKLTASGHLELEGE